LPASLAGRFTARGVVREQGSVVFFEAIDAQGGREVTLAVIPAAALGDAEDRERVLADAQVALGFTHPRAAAVLDAIDAGDAVGVVLERIRGRTLRAEMAERRTWSKPFSDPEARAIGSAVCDALQAAHRFMVHRAVRPETIWLDGAGVPRLAELGLSATFRRAGADPASPYLAPEAIDGDEGGDERSDQWALAATLFELLCGAPPAGPAPSVRGLRPDVSKPLADAIEKGLAQDPKARHADMAAFGAALSGASAAGPRRKALLVALVIALAIAGALVAWKLVQRARERRLSEAVGARNLAADAASSWRTIFRGLKLERAEVDDEWNAIIDEAERACDAALGAGDKLVDAGDTSGAAAAFRAGADAVTAALAKARVKASTLNAARAVRARPLLEVARALAA
jgi:hypothetical protein